MIQLSQEQTGKLVTALLKQQGGMAALMASQAQAQVEYWWSQGVRLSVEEDSSLGKALLAQRQGQRT